MARYVPPRRKSLPSNHGALNRRTPSTEHRGSVPLAARVSLGRPVRQRLDSECCQRRHGVARFGNGRHGTQRGNHTDSASASPTSLTGPRRSSSTAAPWPSHSPVMSASPPTPKSRITPPPPPPRMARSGSPISVFPSSRTQSAARQFGAGRKVRCVANAGKGRSHRRAPVCIRPVG